VSGLSELQPAAAAVKNLSMLRSQLCLLAAGCCSLQVLFDPTIGHRHIAAILLTAQHHRASAIAASILSTHSTVKRKREEKRKRMESKGGRRPAHTLRRLSVSVADWQKQKSKAPDTDFIWKFGTHASAASDFPWETRTGCKFVSV
jgi:hypothetical protein